MKKNTILLWGIVVVCVVVITVMNFIVNRPEPKVSAVQTKIKKADVSVSQPVMQEKQTFSKDEKEPRPEYEATVSNGTILF